MTLRTAFPLDFLISSLGWFTAVGARASMESSRRVSGGAFPRWGRPDFWLYHEITPIKYILFIFKTQMQVLWGGVTVITGPSSLGNPFYYQPVTCLTSPFTETEASMGKTKTKTKQNKTKNPKTKPKGECQQCFQACSSRAPVSWGRPGLSAAPPTGGKCASHSATDSYQKGNMLSNDEDVTRRTYFYR